MRLETTKTMDFNPAEYGMRWVENPFETDDLILRYDGDAPANVETVEIKGEGTEGRLIIRRTDNGFAADWLLVQFHSQEQGKPADWDFVARGVLWCNMACELEPRHTYFGDTGYIYMIDIRLVTQALEIMRQKVMNVARKH